MSERTRAHKHGVEHVRDSQKQESDVHSKHPLLPTDIPRMVNINLRYSEDK